MRRFAWFSAISAALTFPLIGFGAIVRLKGAGLACPDWPLCYGKVTSLGDVVTPAPAGLGIALEVGHRYVAGILGLMVLGLLVAAWTKLREERVATFWSSLAFVVLVPQVVLGGLTVLMKLAPWTVSLHLLFGNLLWASLLALALRSFQESGSERVSVKPSSWPMLKKLVLSAWGLTFVQIFMGGLVSSSGAGVACPDFPLCEGGALVPAGAGTPIWLQLMHRGVGFALAAVFVATLVVAARSAGVPTRLKVGLGAAVGLVGLQILIGWYNVAHHVPVPTSALHTATAATIVGVMTWTAVQAMALKTGTTSAVEAERRDGALSPRAV